MPYQETLLTVEPVSELATDLLAGLLGEIGYESFEPVETGLRAYIPAGAYDETRLREAVNDFPLEGVSVVFESQPIPDRNWNQEWERHYFQPIVIGSECVIHSSFHADVPPARYDIVIDPKMAFGTGHHQTTELMVRALLKTDCRGLSVLDMGCGTAILAILAGMRGAASVTAVDIDEWAYRNAVENVALNGVGPVEIRCGGAEQIAGKTFDLILANINRNILLRDMTAYVSAMRSGSRLCLSGFYTSDIPAVEREASRLGLQSLYADEKERWAAVCFEKF